MVPLEARVYRALVNIPGTDGARGARKRNGRVLPLENEMPLGKFVRPLWTSFARPSIGHHPSHLPFFDPLERS